MVINVHCQTLMGSTLMFYVSLYDDSRQGHFELVARDSWHVFPRHYEAEDEQKLDSVVQELVEELARRFYA